jgi:opacity protein-like surface antigen
MGLYILPFIALQGASPFDANIAELGNSAVSIKQELGFSSGWRIGKRWKNFFIDADFSYFRNKLKKPSVNTLENASFSGAAEGYGGMLNFGGNFNPGTAVSILFGAGLGAFNQEIQASIPTPLGGLDNLALNFNEADTLFAYQLFTGINFYPTERTLLSMKYRWLNIAEMEKFSARNLHMLELAFGCVF